MWMRSASDSAQNIRPDSYSKGHSPCPASLPSHGKVMSLLFNMLSRFVVAFLPRSKHLLISWLQTLFAVILEPKKIKSAH